MNKEGMLCNYLRNHALLFTYGIVYLSYTQFCILPVSVTYIWYFCCLRYNVIFTYYTLSHRHLITVANAEAGTLVITSNNNDDAAFRQQCCNILGFDFYCNLYFQRRPVNNCAGFQPLMTGICFSSRAVYSGYCNTYS